MAKIQGYEAQVLETLKNGEGYDELPEKYSDGPELKDTEFPELKDEEIVTLYGTLTDVSRSELAESLDVSNATISNYRSDLVELNFLRNLQPGRGPADYHPGLRTTDMIEDYIPDIEIFQDVEPARPMEEDKDSLRWLVGEELYEKTSSEKFYPELKRNEAIALELTLEGEGRQEIADRLDVSLPTVSVYRSNLVEAEYMENLQPGRGPGKYIPDDRVIDIWEDYAFPFEGETDDLSWLIGEQLYKMVRRTKNGENPIIQKNNTSKTSEVNTRTDNGKSNRETETGRDEVKEEILELGDKLLDGHREEIKQKERTGIESRDLTDSESENVDVEDDKAGYEGFT